MPSASELAIAGTGRMAQALGRALREAGMPVACVAGRSREHAREAAAFIGGAAAVSFPEAAQRAGRLLIAVSDAAIAPVAREIAIAGGGLRIALHTSGNAGPELLDALAARGVSCGAIHPLQTVFDPETGARALRGIAFAISGGGEASQFAGEIAGRLGGQVLRIPDRARPLYHAAAVMAGNYITALLDAAVETMSRAGVPADRALQALIPLARTAVENAAAAGPAMALTGPIARGDRATVAAHLDALGQAGAPLLNLYRAAGARALEMARRRGLPEETVAGLERLLRRGTMDEHD